MSRRDTPPSWLFREYGDETALFEILYEDEEWVYDSTTTAYSALVLSTGRNPPPFASTLARVDKLLREDDTPASKPPPGTNLELCDHHHERAVLRSTFTRRTSPTLSGGEDEETHRLEETLTAPDHIRDSLGRTRGADKVLSSTDGAKATGAESAEIPVAGGSRGTAPFTTPLDAAIGPNVSPYRIKINRAASATPTDATSGEDGIPNLRTVSNSVESGFDEGLINFGTVNSPDSGGADNAVNPEELMQRYKFLADFTRRGTGGEIEVEVASATPSLTSLVNPGPSAAEEGSNTPTDGPSAARKSTAGVLDNESISQAMQYNREPGRIFISFGRSIEIYNEPLHASVARYHPRYDPLVDHDPLTQYGAVDHVMPGKTVAETMVLRDVLLRLGTPHRKWYWDTLEQAVQSFVKIKLTKYDLMTYGEKEKGAVVHYCLNHVNLEQLAHRVNTGQGLDTLSSVDSTRSSVRSDYGREYPEYELAKLLSRPDYGALAQDQAIKDAFIDEHRVEAKDIRSTYYKIDKTRSAGRRPSAKEIPLDAGFSAAHDPNDLETAQVPPSNEVEGAEFAASNKPTLRWAAVPPSLSAAYTGSVSVLPGIGKMPTTWAIPGSKTDVADIVPQISTARFAPGSSVREVQNAEAARKIAAGYSVVEPTENQPSDPNAAIAASLSHAAPYGAYRTATVGPRTNLTNLTTEGTECPRPEEDHRLSVQRVEQRTLFRETMEELAEVAVTPAEILVELVEFL
ncbi:hypothetical protein B0H16DRAFT_1458261 [Mycena metata]|uniref:Uncharacterized protein n=1 Tax=Mycena metata TaxID=1033252 RepID=A0AAD7J5T3_9AGAR|nr:hypothetical protein B0H16DRAFT_1458261 [Mycena metata]